VFKSHFRVFVSSWFLVRVFVSSWFLVLPARAGATVFASAYVPAQTSGLVSPFDNPGAAVGGPNGLTGVGTKFLGVLSPFNPAYEPKDIVKIGPGGQLTLQFPDFVRVGGGNEVGVVSNNFLVDASGSGANTNPAQVFGSGVPGGGTAEVLVSDDGANWHSIGAHTFDEPANYYQDAASPYQSTPGNNPADFGVPFTHPISDLNGLDWPHTLALFGSSGGGTWLDLGASGLSQIDYIQFRAPSGGGALVIDAVSVNNSDVGAPVPEPMGVGAILLSVAALWRRRR